MGARQAVELEADGSAMLCGILPERDPAPSVSMCGDASGEPSIYARGPALISPLSWEPSYDPTFQGLGVDGAARTRVCRRLDNPVCWPAVGGQPIKDILHEAGKQHKPLVV